MYEEVFGHFRLERNPFAVSANPQDLYSTAAYDETLSQLVFGIETRQGLMVLTGEPGTGKTTILHHLLDWLLTQGYSTAYIFHTLLPSMDLLRLILRDFGISCDAQSKGELVIALTAWLSQRQKMGDNPVIVIDEAQALTSASLEEVRMLLNSEIGGVKLVQVVLAGQPQLEEKLRSPRMAQLRQRMMCHRQVLALTQEETAGYIVKRLAWAGLGDSGLFPPRITREIFKYSKGIPRVINLICERALLSSYVDRRNSVDLNDVLDVAHEFELDGDAEAGQGPSRTNVFRRLSPFPKLSVENAEVKPNKKEEEIPATTVAQSEQEKDIGRMVAKWVLAAGQSSRALPMPANASRPKPIISKGRAMPSGLGSHFLWYWRSVGTSFARDGRKLVDLGVEWLSEPSWALSSAPPTFRTMVYSLRSWLLSPMSSRAMMPHRGPKSSTRLKHP